MSLCHSVLLIIMIHKLKILTLLILISCTISAQKFIYDVDFLTFFDNRESRIPSYPSKTLFGTRLSPEIGVEFNDSLYGNHQLIAGMSYIQPFGSAWRDIRLNPTIYYRYRQHGFNLSFGFIPWRNIKTNLPDYLFSDSLSYFSPNIQGVHFSYASRHGFAEFIADWRGMQSIKTREAFRLLLTGEYHYNFFFAGGNAQLNHLANRLNPPIRDGVCDDITAQPFIGFNFSQITPLDTLALRTSYIFSYQRDRKNNQLFINHGFLAELSIKWRFLAAENTLYVGNPLMPLYEQHSSLLNQGESIYQHSIYNKTEFSVYIIQFPFVDVRFSWNLHYTPHHPLAHQQLLTSHFNLNNLMNKIKKDKRT